MILIDTNVASELFDPFSSGRVRGWFNTQSPSVLYLSTISVAEMRFGVAILPVGRHKSALDEALERRLLRRFDGRVLHFDLPASRAYASIMSAARARGLAIGVADGMIAATAAANGMSVATRDVVPFQTAGLDVINPWL